MKDWDRELAKIDRQLGSMPDEALLPAKPERSAPSVPAGAAPAAQGKTIWVVARVALVAALAAGAWFWPYPTRCGAGLFGYLAAVGTIVVGGAWSATWAWRHRAAKSHIASLALMLWGATLAAREVLPRIGYAIPTEARPAIWMCE